MTIPTRNLTLVPHNPRHLLALLMSSDEYEKLSGVRIVEGVRELLLSASPNFFAQLQTAMEPDPWKIGFAIVQKIDDGAGGRRATSTGEPARVDGPESESKNLVIGTCGFAAPPDPDGVAEIGYGIAPSYQGKGYASEAAAALVDFASRDARVKTVRAHTLAQTNASTRILEKCGFQKIRDAVDSENNASVWVWERPAK
jgi:[ribosomal protein S5]-alanine N-acetyltransferase